MMNRTTGTTAGLAAATLLLAAAAGADWLVTRGNTRIETRGPWRVEGARVVFTRTDGRFVTLPLALLDMDRSRAATAAAAAATPAPTTAPRTEIVRVTDADVAHVDPRASVAGQSAGVAPGQRSTTPPRVVLYSAAWCGWCSKARSLLADLGVAYVEKDIDKEPAARSELLRHTGGRFAVPVFDIGGTVVQGYSPERVRALLTDGPGDTAPADRPR